MVGFLGVVHLGWMAAQQLNPWLNFLNSPTAPPDPSAALRAIGAQQRLLRTLQATHKPVTDGEPFGVGEGSSTVFARQQRPKTKGNRLGNIARTYWFTVFLRIFMCNVESLRNQKSRTILLRQLVLLALGGFKLMVKWTSQRQIVFQAGGIPSFASQPFVKRMGNSENGGG